MDEARANPVLGSEPIRRQSLARIQSGAQCHDALMDVELTTVARSAMPLSRRQPWRFRLWREEGAREAWGLTI
jgi:hypothetical protein